MNKAEKLAAAMDSRVVRNWVHSTGESPRATGFKHDAECQQAAALIRRQAAQIKELREALGKARQDINWMLNSRKFLDGFVFEYIDEALAATKEET